ncbi:hypothetical protein AWC38_SpisGene23289 [Stylophora pistillata]|uniref:Endonuclease/exonuclease/phosphatase domain-containing protein n=1 Tax=Stylophora pistillata TaxID=50429 RepID=A0A2B4R8K0_STYPI|nr:hypothetical protein AWC38_SpisGene23289 [Stylophora pistillata]
MSSSRANGHPLQQNLSSSRRGILAIGTRTCDAKHHGNFAVQLCTHVKNSRTASTWPKVLRRLYNIDIAARQETRRAGEGQLTERGAGYTFFWMGKEENEQRIHGVGFALKKELIRNLEELPVGVSERLMTLRLKLKSNQQATVISAYAPTLQVEPEDKEIFYSTLDSVLTQTPSNDKIILLGDFNAWVGRTGIRLHGDILDHATGSTILYV